MIKYSLGIAGICLILAIIIPGLLSTVIVAFIGGISFGLGLAKKIK